MRFVALLSLTALLTGCCHTRVAEPPCGPRSGCDTDCKTKPKCQKAGDLFAKDRCQSRACPPKRCCPTPRSQCRSSLTIEWKPICYPVLRRKKMHEVCLPKSDCRTGCRQSVNSGETQFGPVTTSEPRVIQSDRVPFGDAPVLEPPALNSSTGTDEAAIPGVPAQNGGQQAPAAQDSSAADASSAAYGGRYYNPQTGVPEIPDTAAFRQTSSRSVQTGRDSRMAVEMWPHSPQYTGRR